VGPLFYGNDQGGEVFLGYSMGQPSQAISEEMANLIDDEVKKIVEGAHQKATRILTENIEQLHAIAKALLEYETLSGDEIKAVLAGEAIRRNDGEAAKKPTLVKSSLPSSRTKKTGTDDQPQA
jgi:cell division protease FtsH